MQQEIDKVQISDEGVVALPRSLTRALHIEPGDDVLIRVEETRIVLHRMNPHRAQPRPLGHGKGDLALPEGWETAMSDQEADDFLNGR